MAVFDTGPIDNRNTPRITQLTIRLLNTGRLPALVGVEAYQVNPDGAGFGIETLYITNQVNLSPFNTPNSTFTLDNVFADVDVFGVGCSRVDLVPTILLLPFCKKVPPGKLSENMCWKGN